VIGGLLDDRAASRRQTGAHPPFAETSGSGVPLTAPVRLLPVTVPKPWGREYWFTGVEPHRESRVAVCGGELTLRAYLSLAPEALCGARLPVLMKYLEPRPVPFIGDLYFEVHDSKHEVYVVTDVNRSAHPDGIGAVRLGVDQALRDAMADDARFRRAFLEALHRFEACRLASDAGTGDPRAEAAARSRVLAFTRSVPVRPGDVVTVPAGYPHALQHGVRVVEIQTPNHQRSIVYATQRVVTQPRWDSAAAVARMRLETPPVSTPTVAAGGAMARLAEFPDFTVCRLRLPPRTCWTDEASRPYAICLATRGPVFLGNRALRLGTGEAAFVPGSAGPVSAVSAGPGELLLALPG